MAETRSKKDDYFEIKIPKATGGKVPVILVIILMLLSYVAGILTMRFYLTYQKSQVVSDATGAFKSYARDLKLNMKDFDACLDSGKYKNRVNEDITNGSSLGVGATPTFFVNGRMILGSQPYDLFSQMIEQELSGNRTPLTEEETASNSATAITVAKGNLPIVGKADAPVTIVEFSDFQCPFCERFYVETLPELKKNYIDTGKVQLTFRHYPIQSLHPNAPLAHEASECANDQGKFWEYHNILFETQAAWSELPLTPKPSTSS